MIGHEASEPPRAGSGTVEASPEAGPPMLSKILAVCLVVAFALRFFVRAKITVRGRSVRLLDLALVLIVVSYAVQLAMLAV